MSFQYTGRAGKAAVVSLRLSHHYKDADRFIRQYLRGTTAVFTPESYQVFSDLGILDIEYCTVVVYSDSTNRNLLVNKQMAAGLHKDHMPVKARNNYLKHELLLARNPLEAIAFASDNAITFGKIHTTEALQKHLNETLGQEQWDSAIVFIDVFDQKPDFVDVEINFEV